MPLIVAVEPDRRQAAQLKRLARGCAAELVLADTTERAIEAIGNRTPDLVLVPALLSPQDDAALATALRVIAAAAHVQTLTIPVFAAPTMPDHGGGVLSMWRRGRSSSTSEGCDPAVFGEQIAAYLAEAAAARQALELEEADIAAQVEAAAPVVEAVSEWDAIELPPEPVEVVATEEAEKIDLNAFINELEESRPIEAGAPPVYVAPEPVPAPEPVFEVALEQDREQEPDRIAKPVPTELWAALSLKPHRWPRLDAVIAEARAAAPAPAPSPAPEPEPEPVRAAAPRVDWVDMLDALRHDIDRLRTERTVTGQAPAQPVPPPPVVVAHPAPPRREQPPVAATSRKQRRKKDPKPLQDEWGFFDPQQCGFTALLAKLDEISDSGQ
jgi:hypothetical protein